MSYSGYWQKRADLCKEFADEGECLAQVARHVPVTIGGIGGLGQDTTAQDVRTAVHVTAQLFSNPDAALRTYGPPIVTAAEQHVVDPLVDRIGQSMAPYAVKYLLPPLALIYVLTGISAYYSYQTAQRMRKNPRRVRRNRRRRRSSRRRRRTSRRR